MEADKEREEEVIMEICLENEDFSDGSEQVEGRQNHRDEECTLRVAGHTKQDGMNKENSINDSSFDNVSHELEVKTESRKKIKKVEKKVYPCDQCSLVSHSSANYNKHLMTHTGEKPFTCPICHKAFRQKNHLIDHQRIHMRERRFECEVCGCQFIQKSSLNVHRKRHKGVKPFSCTECNYTAFEKVQLKIHMRKHTGEKPYQCDKCGKTFSSANRLKFHCMIHTGERRYRCAKCGVPFREKATLEAHMAVHLTIGPFKCEECGQQFSRLASLSLHRKVHENRDSFLYVHNQEALQYFNKALEEESNKKALEMREPSRETESGQRTGLSEANMTSSENPVDSVQESVVVRPERQAGPVTSPQHPPKTVPIPPSSPHGNYSPQHPPNTVPMPSSSPHDNYSPIRSVISSSEIDSQEKLKENLASNLSVKKNCSDINPDQVRKALELGTVLETHGDDGKDFFIILPPSLKNKELMMMSNSLQSAASDKPNSNKMSTEESASPFGQSNSLPNMLSGNGSGPRESRYLRDEKEVEEVSDMTSRTLEEEMCSDVEGEMIHPYEAESVESTFNKGHLKGLETMGAFEEHVHSDGTSVHLWKSGTDKLTDVTYIIESGETEPFIIQTEQEGMSELCRDNGLEGNQWQSSDRRNYYIVEEREGRDGKRSSRCIPVKIDVNGRKGRVRKMRTKRDYKCEYCGKDCKNSSNYIAHSRTHSGERPYFCGICREGFKQMSHLRSHFRIHTGEKPYVCGLCLASFTQSSTLNSHKKKAHPGGQLQVKEKKEKEKYVPENRIRNFYCQYCKKTFIGECLKVDHMRMHRSSFRYSCKICGMQFKCRSSVRKHYLRHADNRHVCEVCGIEAATLEELHKHRLEEHSKSPSNDSCINIRIGEDSAVNVFNETLANPVKRESYTEGETTVCEVKEEVIHVTDDGGSIRSEVEGTSVCQETRVAIHDITHVSPAKKKERRGQGKEFSASKDSDKGALSSLGDDCDSAGKEGERSRQIKTYIGDDGKKVWMCQVCDRSFAQSSNLHSHMRLHTGDKPYQCTVCLQAFRQITHLKDHMRRHTGARPHKCSKCSKRFIQKSALKRHIRLLHDGHAVPLTEGESNLKTEISDAPRDCDDVGRSDISEVSEDARTHTNTFVENLSRVGKKDIRTSGKAPNIEKGRQSIPKNSCECGKRFYTISQLLKHQEICSIMQDEEDSLDSETASVGSEEENLEDEMEVLGQKGNEEQKSSLRKSISNNNTDNRKRKHKTSTSDDNPTKKSQFKCKECDEVLLGIASYKRHLEGHGSEVHQVCSMCGEVFKRVSTLRYHQILKHGREDRRYKDYYSAGRITDQEDLEEGIVKVKLEVEDDEIFSPSDDDFKEETAANTTSSKRELRQTVKAVKTDALKIINNTIKKAKSDGELSESSLNTKTETRNHVCPVCGMRFTQSFKLRLHKSKCKGNSKSSTGKLVDGDKKLTNQGRNKDSKRSISTPKCPVELGSREGNLLSGDGDFGKTSARIKKRVVESGAVEFRCKFCDKLFVDTSSYEEHLLIHSVDKPFQCEQCCMSFRRKPHLFNHYRRHARKNL